MKYTFDNLIIVARGEVEKKAAVIFAEEIKSRVEYLPKIISEKADGKCFEFVIAEKGESEDFTVLQTVRGITVTAHRLRALLYGAGLFLRKCEFKNGSITLTADISGTYTPSMPIRGHQLSFKEMNNTFDAWTREQYRQYIIDLALFGNNTVEGDSGRKNEKNPLMKYTPHEALLFTAEICEELDMDFSVWHPLSTEMTDEEAVEDVSQRYGDLCKLDVIFPPGGDPGDLQAEDFIERCKKIKRELQKRFPNIKMYPSAQAPHCYPDWGERFVKKIEELPEEIDGIIYGPNHAMPLDEMRRKINPRYPFRFYPDIAHNVRCEVPVHFQNNDWHYSLAATLSREAVNPRPAEYRLLHRLTAQYVDGSVTYSEGVNDDLNKFIWSLSDFDFDCDLRESVRDYCRAFFAGTDIEALTDGLLSLEQNWVGDPALNSTIDYSFLIFTQLEKDYPFLSDNWRFQLYLFRAYCDKLIRERRVFELGLIEKARNNINNAADILREEYPKECIEKREKLFALAQKLFRLIGIQLDVERFGGLSWERGCTLDTIDNPVTDRQWLLNKITADPKNAEDYLNRNRVERDEYYFSFAEHGFEICGVQQGEYYYDFRGDRNLDCALPMCMTKVYDHFNFKCGVAGLTGGDYILRITYKERRNDEIRHHRVCVNGNVVHDGTQFGGKRDTLFEKKFLADGYQSVVYDIPKKLLVNGCAELEITEPIDGFMISEFSFTKYKQ